MTMSADWLEMLGQDALGMFWLPLLAWTTVALAAMGLLRVWGSAHALVHYTARAALLLALPLGLVLAPATDFSFFPPLPISTDGAMAGSFADAPTAEIFMTGPATSVRNWTPCSKPSTTTPYPSRWQPRT